MSNDNGPSERRVIREKRRATKFHAWRQQSNRNRIAHHGNRSIDVGIKTNSLGAALQLSGERRIRPE